MSYQPELVWVIEPENKIRFRYESEGGSHGALAGKTGKKTYPTLQLKNYFGRKKILVRASLYTEDEKEHVFEFKGKKDEGKKRYIDEELQNDGKVVFKNIHILCKKKYEIEQILMERKLNNLKDGMSRTVRQTLEKSYTKDVKDRARSILNSLRLRFQAFEADKINSDEPLCTLFSDVISNLKAAGKGDLRICRLSQVAGTWKGGDEIILLCEKVQKDNIKVKFYETDELNCVIWEEYAKFSPLDVHYQVAIPFKMPRYKRNEEKKVFVCLERDEERSEPREFTYKSDEPSMKKRKLEIPDSDISEIWPQSSTGSVSSLSVSSPYSSSNAASNEVSSDFLLDGLDQTDNKDEPMFFDMNSDFDLCKYIGNPQDYDLSFDNLLSSNLDDFDIACDGPCIPKTKKQILKHSYERVCMPIDVIDAPKNKEVEKNQNLDLIDINEALGNLKLKNEHELESGSVNKLVKKENVSSRNSFHNLQHLLETDSYGNTLLHIGVILDKNIIPILRISNAVKVDLINIQNHKNQTALHIATEKNRSEAVKILLRLGSNPNLKDSNGNTCYHIASRNNYTHILNEINLFSRFPHEVCVFNDDGLTPMHQAILQRNVHSFDLLKIHIINSNVVEKKSGKSLLHYAVDFLPILLPELLDMDDLNVNIQDFEGNTPLHIACANENVAAVKKLLQAGADPCIKNFKQNSNTLGIEDSDASDGQLPADLTVNFEILKLLSDASGDSFSFQNSCSCPEPYEKPCQITEKLCKYLNEDMKWKKLVPYFFDDYVMDSLNLSPNPARTLLGNVKKQEKDKYLELLKAVLERADLNEAVNIMNETNVVN